MERDKKESAEDSEAYRYGDVDAEEMEELIRRSRALIARIDAHLKRPAPGARYQPE